MLRLLLGRSSRKHTKKSSVTQTIASSADLMRLTSKWGGSMASGQLKKKGKR
ncbi:uncharacterized protein J3R85_004717 [Psidium guajava]|nr:uncharacterized protein J3R85_004717 [Psidium guajava]